MKLEAKEECFPAKRSTRSVAGGARGTPSSVPAAGSLWRKRESRDLPVFRTSAGEAGTTARSADVAWSWIAEGVIFGGISAPYDRSTVRPARFDDP